MKKILILFTAVGQGHKVIAENITWHLRQAGAEVVLYDAYKLEEGAATKWGEKIFLNVYRSFPFVWSWLYKTGWVINLLLPFRLLAARFHFRKILEVIDKERPDLIISTQTSPSAVMEYLVQQKKYEGQFWIAFSDFHLHKFWLYPHADHYLINTPEQKQAMVNMGVAENKITVCGITLQPQPNIDTEIVRQKINVIPGQKVVVLASGSLGELMPTAIIESLSELNVNDIPVKLVIVCGKNTKLAGELSAKYASQSNISVHGFYKPFTELYSVADILVSKPGGLTVAESLLWGIPLIVTHFLPGQEELNIEYLSARGLVTTALRADTLKSVIIEELMHGQIKSALLSDKYRLSFLSVSDGSRIITLINSN